MTGQYEFSARDNETIGKAGLWAFILGILFFVQAGFALVPDFNFVAAGVDVTIGIFYLLGGRALKAVVATEGRDVTFMLSALSKMGNAFLVRIIVMSIVLALIVTVGVIAGIAVAAE